MIKRSPKDEPYIIKGKYDLLYEIHPNSLLDTLIAKHGITQDWIAFNLNKIVDEEATILDIGANVGIYTLPFSKICSFGRIYAIEPDPENFEQLTRNVKLNKLKNVFPFELAMQENPNVTESDFYIRRYTDFDKLLNRGLSTLEKNPYHNKENHKVSCSTIDKFFEEQQINRLDFIKIDVEGSEYKVFLGGIKSISKYLPIIQYEFSTIIDKEVGFSNTEKCFELFKKIEYQQYVVQNNVKLVELKEFDENQSDCNVLAIPRGKKLPDTDNPVESTKPVIMSKTLGE